MSALRSLLSGVGVALAALGLLLVLVPGVAGALSLSRLGVLVLGIFALVQAARSLRSRWRTTIEGAELPAPERRLETERPGDDFDARVAALAGGIGRSHGARYERLRRRLRDAAVDVTARRWRLPDQAAQERVAAGEWTDDPAAAWFLGDGSVPPPPWPVRVRAFAASGSAIGYYANRTAEAVVALREAT